MIHVIVYAMVFSGAALMIYNIYGFIRFAQNVKDQKSWKRDNRVLHIPIILLILFFLGYVAVGTFGKPDLIVGGILFGGSIFVYIMYRLLSSIVDQILEGEELHVELLASEKSNEAKTSFLSNISHEMRTPMNVILGLDAMALREPELKDSTRLKLEKIGLSARHLLGLINSILDMNQFGTGEFKVKQREFSLRESLEQVNAMAQTMCEEKGLRYEVTGMEAAEGLYLGDEMLLKKVLINLLDNAVKYTDAPGSVDFELEAGPREGDKRSFRFRVRDTGVGMEPDFLKRAFEVFSKEDASATSRHGGAGMGLAVTKHTVEEMGGSIRAESRKHQGSIFVVELPLRLSSRQGLPVAQGREPVSLEGKRILIVEDIPENAEIVMDLLELKGVETEHAENGAVGLRMFRDSPEYYYDAVLMDLRMPVMDGLEATRQIRALERKDAQEVPIVALTANAFESDIRDSLAVGMNAHLAKPADSDVLYDTLRRLMRNREDTEGSVIR